MKFSAFRSDFVLVDELSFPHCPYLNTLYTQIRTEGLSGKHGECWIDTLITVMNDFYRNYPNELLLVSSLLIFVVKNRSMSIKMI